MLSEALAALAAAGGTAVIQAAGTDAWAGFRDQIAKWFGRTDARREQVALERLDQDAAALSAASPDEVEQMRVRQEAAWQARFESELESLEGDDQRHAADRLRALFGSFAGSRAAASGQGAVAVGGDVSIHAETGGVAAWQMGNVQAGGWPDRSSAGSGAAADPH